MAVRFEFDAINKLLVARLEGKLTDELLAEFYEAVRGHATATDACAGIADFSGVTEFAVSNAMVRRLARQEPAMPDPTRRPRMVAAPQAHVYGICRMFQLMGESTRPLLTIVHTMDEALTKLGVQSPHLEPLE
ncbi:MAG: hypothetical protein ACLPLR_14755 [Terriglobales bacterium]